MVVTDAALGNVDERGCVSGASTEKLHSQGCYAVLLADASMMAGLRGSFNVLDFRSHRIPRVCRSSYAAETLSAEEGMDAAELLRGFVAEARGYDVSGKDAYLQVARVSLVGVTHAKDTYDRITSDTGFGSQKSLMFTVANMRQQLKRPNTSYRWTATSNMFVDAGTKLMDTSHLRQTLANGSWSVTYAPEFVKQTAKKKKPDDSSGVREESLPGRSTTADDAELLRFATMFGEAPGWHFADGVGVHSAHGAKSYRSPNPRFAIKDFPLRSTVAEFKDPEGLPIWRILEERSDLRSMANLQEVLPRRASRLISFYQPPAKATEKHIDDKS